MDSSLSDEKEYEDEKSMMKTILAYVLHAEEHVISYKRSVQGHPMLNWMSKMHWRYLNLRRKHTLVTVLQNTANTVTQYVYT